jgi:hypothetical protein
MAKRAKAEHPAQVMSARVPYDLAQATRAEAKKRGETTSAAIRAGLRSLLSGSSSAWERAAVKELVAVAEKGGDIAEVAGLLQATAETKAEEKFVETAALQIADLTATVAKAAKQGKAPKAPKEQAKPFAETLAGRDIAERFRLARSQNDLDDLTTKALERASSSREKAFIKAEASKVRAENKRALAKQKKAIPKPKKTKKTFALPQLPAGSSPAAPQKKKRGRPRKVKTFAQEKARALRARGPGKGKATVFYPTAGKNSVTKSIEINAPNAFAGVAEFIAEASKVSGLNLKARQSKGPTEIQTDAGIYYRGGKSLLHSDGMVAHDIEFRSWEELDKRPFVETKEKRAPDYRQALKKKPDEEVKALPQLTPAGVESPEERALYEWAENIVNYRNKHQGQGYRDIRDEWKGQDLARAALLSKDRIYPDLDRKARQEKAKAHQDLARVYADLPRGGKEEIQSLIERSYALAWTDAAKMTKKKSPEQVKPPREGGKKTGYSVAELEAMAPNRTTADYIKIIHDWKEGRPKTKAELLEVMKAIRAEELAMTPTEKQNLRQAQSDEIRRLNAAGEMYTWTPEKITFKQLLEARSVPELDRIQDKLIHAAKQPEDRREIKTQARWVRKYGKLAQREEKRPSSSRRAKIKEACEGEACTYSIEGGRCSIKAPLTIGGKDGGTEKIPARYCLTEIDELKTSNQPTRNYSPTPGYPKDAQERDYQKEIGEQAKVQRIADSYDPELIFIAAPGAIDGLPVANESGFVLGGNGRAMATKLVYAGEGKYPAEKVKRYIKDNAEQFGLQARDVEKFKAPMIVRTIRTGSEPRELALWSRRLNQSLSQQLSPTLIAVSRAKFINPAALEELRALPDDETLAAWLSSQQSRGFVRSLEASNIIDTRSAPTFILPNGLLSPEGRDMVNDLLVGVLVEDADLIKMLGPGTTGTIAKAAPYLAQLKSLGRYDILPQFSKALRDRVKMQKAKFTDVRSFLAQGGMFGGNSAVQGDPIAELWLKSLTTLGSSPAKLTKLARRYTYLAKGPSSGQFALLQEEHLEPYAALERAAIEQGVKL